MRIGRKAFGERFFESLFCVSFTTGKQFELVGEVELPRFERGQRLGFDVLRGRERLGSRLRGAFVERQPTL